MSARSILVTGGAGYVGAPLCEALLASGDRVRVLDALLHGQEDVAERLRGRGAEVIRGDVRDEDDRARALSGIDAVVHLAAIVGDPACARDPARAHAINIEGTRDLLRDMRTRGVRRLIFASTCSNYGRMADASVMASEDSPLAPVSLYAEQKVTIEQELLGGTWPELQVTCLRFATVYGVAQRMRFDLTVNEFTRDLWAGRELQVYGEQFWRPYIHVRDAVAATMLALDRSRDLPARTVFNAGSTAENYRKADIVSLVQRHVADGRVVSVPQVEDPRDYRVSFERIARELGFRTTMTVEDGIRELLAALDAGTFGDPYDPKYTNTP